MKQIFLYGGLPLLAMVSLTGCIDDNYDLSDIDTTSEFKVKDLVLPINIDVVTLGDIIDIKEGDQIKEITINGETFYAVRESGSFATDPISIPAFTTNAPAIQPSAINFNTGSTRKAPNRVSENSLTLSMQDPIRRSLVYSAYNIDNSIMAIDDIFADLSIALTFEADPSVTNLADISLENLYLDLPKGLTITNIFPEGNYNEGRLVIPRLYLEEGIAKVVLEASAINLPDNNCAIDYSSHSMQLQADVNIESADLVMAPKSYAAVELPQSVTLNVNYSISCLAANAVSGKIRYMLEGDAMNISPISLSDIPDFLAQDGTDLILANPQIYLSVNNPVANENLGYQTGLCLTAHRNNEAPKEFTLDNEYFEVGYNKNVDGPYNFCLSPQAPENVPDGYANPQHVAFTSLSNVISGNGIPASIGIELVEPQVYEQNVIHFELGRNLNALEGNWEFIAPLAMKNGSDSKIIYTETKNGWNDDDVDAITISTLELSMTVSSTLPLSAHLSGYPIDINGNQISGVTIEGAEIPANAQDTPLTIRITGEVKHLDGITFTATVKPDSDKALSPSQTLTLKNIRAKVTGNYIKEL